MRTTRTTIKIRKFESTVVRRTIVNGQDEGVKKTGETEMEDIGAAIVRIGVGAIESAEPSISTEIEGED